MFGSSWLMCQAFSNIHLMHCNHICRTGILDNQNRASFRISDTASVVILLLRHLLKRIRAFCIWDNCKYQLPLPLPIDWKGHQISTLSVQAEFSLFLYDSFVRHIANNPYYVSYSHTPHSNPTLIVRLRIFNLPKYPRATSP